MTTPGTPWQHWGCQGSCLGAPVGIARRFCISGVQAFTILNKDWMVESLVKCFRTELCTAHQTCFDIVRLLNLCGSGVRGHAQQSIVLRLFDSSAWHPEGTITRGLPASVRSIRKRGTLEGTEDDRPRSRGSLCPLQDDLGTPSESTTEKQLLRRTCLLQWERLFCGNSSMSCTCEDDN